MSEPKFTRTEHKVDPRFQHLGPKQGRTEKGSFGNAYSNTFSSVHELGAVKAKKSRASFQPQPAANNEFDGLKGVYHDRGKKPSVSGAAAPNRATAPAERQRGNFEPRAEHEKTHQRNWFESKTHAPRVTSPTPATPHVVAANANAGGTRRTPTRGDELGARYGTMPDHLAQQAAKKERRKTVGVGGWKQGSGKHAA